MKGEIDSTLEVIVAFVQANELAEAESVEFDHRTDHGECPSCGGSVGSTTSTPLYEIILDNGKHTVLRVDLEVRNRFRRRGSRGVVPVSYLCLRSSLPRNGRVNKPASKRACRLRTSWS